MIVPGAIFTAVLLDLPGPQFLELYLFAASAAILFLAILRGSLDKTGGLRPPPLDPKINPFELAWIRGGENEVIRLLLLDLIHRDYVTSKTGLLGSKSLVRNPTGPDRRHLSKESKSLLRIVETASSPKEVFESASLIVAQWATPWQAEAVEKRLIFGPEAQTKLNQPAIGLGALLLLLGCAKLSYASEHGHHNIGFLLILMVVGGIVLALVRRAPRLTKLGQAYVNQAKTAFAQLRARTPALVTQRDPSLLLAVATFGIEVLAPTAYGFYPEIYQRAAQSSSGGCGSSCGSGGGCGGGGCGGGGCGGCGGS
jgi:uncharacterized protein (TIGR04222 family)